MNFQQKYPGRNYKNHTKGNLIPLVWWRVPVLKEFQPLQQKKKKRQSHRKPESNREAREAEERTQWACALRPTAASSSAESSCGAPLPFSAALTSILSPARNPCLRTALLVGLHRHWLRATLWRMDSMLEHRTQRMSTFLLLCFLEEMRLVVD